MTDIARGLSRLAESRPPSPTAVTIPSWFLGWMVFQGLAIIALLAVVLLK